MSNDLPKIWDENIKYDPETGEIIEEYQNTDLLVIEDEIPLPTIEEQSEIVATSTISEENKGMLNSLIEMNAVAQTLAAIRSNESAEQRKNVISMICENFVSSRMRNNATAEILKNKLLERLLNNIDHLDLETTARIYNDLSDTSSVDAQQAMAQLNGGGMGNTGGSGGINLTINNAGEGAAITTNTLNATGQGISHLKETATLNASLKAWNNIPLPKKKNVIDAEYTTEKE